MKHSTTFLLTVAAMALSQGAAEAVSPKFVLESETRSSTIGSRVCPGSRGYWVKNIGSSRGSVTIVAHATEVGRESDTDTTTYTLEPGKRKYLGSDNYNGRQLCSIRKSFTIKR